MEPTLHDGGVHFIYLLAYRWNEPRRGDLVAVAMPGRRAYYLKRILGLPGEEIAFRDGSLLIDGRSFNESYLADQGDWNLEPMRIPEGSYFIAGDNRTTSFEGHKLGLVERRRLSGRLWR